MDPAECIIVHPNQIVEFTDVALFAPCPAEILAQGMSSTPMQTPATTSNTSDLSVEFEEDASAGKTETRSVDYAVLEFTDNAIDFTDGQPVPPASSEVIVIGVPPSAVPGDSASLPPAAPEQKS
jgi:hypothetical protein